MVYLFYEMITLILLFVPLKKITKMRKKILSLTIVLFSQLFFSQVGIGTPTPRGALDINKPTTNNMGLVLPANADVSNNY